MSIKHFIIIWNKILRESISSYKEAIQWFCILFIIVTFRIYLEGFLEAFKTLVPFSAFMGNFSFYIVVFLSVLLFLLISTGKSISFIIKPLVIGFSMIVTVPIVDYLISGGKGFYLAYPNISPSQILKSFPTVMNNIPGISPGMRIEVVAAILALFLFGIIYWKIRWWHALFLSVGLYIILFLTGIYPSLIGSLSMPPQWRQGQGYPRYYFQIPPMETRWMIVIGLEIPILGFIETKNTLTKFFKGVKISRLLFYTMIPLFGILLARKLGPSLMKNIRSLTLTQYGSRAVPVEEIPVRIILTLASTASAYIFAQMINDWFDRETDRINNQKNIFNLGILPSGTIRAYGTICGIWALSSGLSMGWIPFVFIATSIAGSIIYSAKPIRLKRLPVLSSVVISLICGMLIGYGFSFLPNHHIKRLFPRNLIWIILTALPLGLQVKDLKDMAGDHATGIWTIPVLFGKRWGVYAGGFLTIAGFILTGKIMGGFVPIAAAIICSLIIFICVFRARYAWSAHAAILGFALMSGIYLWRESMEI